MALLGREFGVPEQDLGPEAELLDSGILDSLAVIELVVTLQSTFGIVVYDADVDPQWFNSPAAIARLVDLRRGSRIALAA